MGLLFIAVQLIDIVFFLLVPLGIERIELLSRNPGPLSFRLPFMPYTHSLVAVLCWALLAAGVCLILKRRSWAMAVGAAVISHWFLDFLVHLKDLPIFLDGGPKLGLSLWLYPFASYLIEAVLLTVTFLFLRPQWSLKTVGFLALLVGIQAAYVFAIPTPLGPAQVSLSALGSYVCLAMVAWTVFDR